MSRVYCILTILWTFVACQAAPLHSDQVPTAAISPTPHPALAIQPTLTPRLINDPPTPTNDPCSGAQLCTPTAILHPAITLSVTTPSATPNPLIISALPAETLPPLAQTLPATLSAPGATV